MAKPSIAFRARNKATRDFIEMLGQFDKPTRKYILGKALEFDLAPERKTFRWHKLKESSRGSHVPESFSVSITMSLRAIYFEENGVRVWYWVGTHADYDRFCG